MIKRKSSKDVLDVRPDAQRWVEGVERLRARINDAPLKEAYRRARAEGLEKSPERVARVLEIMDQWDATALVEVAAGRRRAHSRSTAARKEATRLRTAREGTMGRASSEAAQRLQRLDEALDFVAPGIGTPVTATLSYDHRAELAASRITPEEADLAGIWSEGNAVYLRVVLRCARHKRDEYAEFLMFPYFRPGLAGAQGLRAKRTGRYPRYYQPTGVRTGIYFPPRTRADGRLQDTSVPLVFVEGEKKALVLDRTGWAVVGAPGVFNFQRPRKGHKEKPSLHPWILEDVRLEGREAVIAFDSDINTNSHVRQAAERLEQMLLEAGAASVRHVGWPDSAVKIGVDDWAAREGDQGVLRLLMDAAPLAHAVASPKSLCVPKRAVRDQDLDRTAKRVLGRLATAERIKASADHLARELAISPDQVRRAIRKLETCGYVETEPGERKRKDDRWIAQPNSYRVLDRDRSLAVRAEGDFAVNLAVAVLGQTPGVWVTTRDLAKKLGESERSVRRLITQLREVSGVEAERGMTRVVREVAQNET